MKLITREISNANGIVVKVAAENLDAGNCNEFKELIQDHLTSKQQVVLDLNTLQFVDSSGLGALLSCLRAMNNKEGKLKLVGLNKPVRALFELVRMHRIFSIYNTLDEAIASF